MNSFFSDNGGSFVVGEDIHGYLPLVQKSKDILKKAIYKIRGGVKIADIGGLIHSEAKKSGYTVIKNLCGHGIGKGLHEEPGNILNYRDRLDRQRFKKNSAIAVETFISTRSTIAQDNGDGWTLVGDKGGFVCQHEHTLIVTEGEPLILTLENDIWK